ncbi:serine/threonine phosphatase, partial [Candidatus Magnetoovum chiemensis]
MYKVNYYCLTDKGRVRKRNEDNFYADGKQGIFIVSDGMGGHAAGDVASRVVVEMAYKLIYKRTKGIMDFSSSQIVDSISQALSELNTHVYKASKSKPTLSGMGATIVLLMINREGKALIAHMGDSRVYMFRDDKLKQLTKDHSVVQALIDAGEIKENEISDHPARGKITRCMGMGGEIYPDIQVMDIKADDRYILCSDGLTGMVSEHKIARYLKEHSEAETAAKALVEAANLAGGVDNITVIIIDYKEVAEEKSSLDTGPTRDFIEDVVNHSDKPVAFVMDMEEQPSRFTLPIYFPSFAIGRAQESNLRITDDTSISRNHCIIKVQPTQNGFDLLVKDLSRNGTYIEGRRINGTEKLPIPSSLMVGKTKLSIVPAGTELNKESLSEDVYSTEGSIVIPPSEFFQERSEALMVVDLVGSTKVVQKYGDTKFVKIVSVLGQVLDRALKAESQPFSKCTGDGYFATFASADAALKTATVFAPTIIKHFTEIPVRLSVALHYGAVRLSADGERTGRNAHAVFSVEDLRHREERVSGLLNDQDKKVIILMTEPFYLNLRDDLQIKAKYIGSYTLKGLE